MMHCCIYAGIQLREYLLTSLLVITEVLHRYKNQHLQSKKLVAKLIRLQQQYTICKALNKYEKDF